MTRPSVLIVLALLAAPAAFVAPAAAQVPCEDVLAEAWCAALPDAEAPPEDACGAVFSPAVCDALPDAGGIAPACDATPAAPACGALAAPLALVDAAFCDATGRSVDGGCPLWQHAFEPGVDIATRMLSVPSLNRVFLVGYANGASRDAAAWALDATTGEQVWRATWDRAGYTEYAGALALSPDGATLAITGAAQWGSSYDVLVLVLDAATGAQRWNATWHGGYASDVGAAVAFSHDGSQLHVAGTALAVFQHTHCSGWSCFTHLHQHTDAVLLGYGAGDPTLQSLFRYGIYPDNRESIGGIATDARGSIWLAMDTQAFMGGTPQGRLLMFSGGSLVNAQQLTADFSARSDPLGVALTPDQSRVLVAARLAGGVGLASFDATNGARQWDTAAASDVALFGTDWSLSPDGSTTYLAAIGYEANAARSANVFALSTADGTTMWRARSAQTSYEASGAVHASANGGAVYVHVGRQLSDGTYAARLLALDPASGALRVDMDGGPGGSVSVGVGSGVDGGPVLASYRYDAELSAYRGWAQAHDAGALHDVRAAVPPAP